jgi:uncharacterized protein (TIGR00159 family)
MEVSEQKEAHIKAIKRAMLRMARRKTGALIVITKNLSLDGMVNSGVPLDASISDPLLESIFNKESPLHDGAVLIANGQVKAASVILPVSENPKLPKSAGLRHRAAVGLSERIDIAAFIVSEETGNISLAYKGELIRKLSEEKLKQLLDQHYV